MLGELTTSNATNTYKGSTTRAQIPEWRRASLIRVRENPIKGCYGEKANRHPHGWRRRPRPQLGHKNRHLPQQRERYRGRRSPSRLGGADALEDSNSRWRYVMALDRENTRTIDRRGGTLLHSSRTNP